MLTDPRGWPRGWPGVRTVQTLREGPADGFSAVCRIEWASRLPGRIVIEVDAVGALRQERLRGAGIWLLHTDDDDTAITCVWRVELATPWMRWVSPLRALVVRRHHDRVMHVGAIGLASSLAAGERGAVVQAAR